MSTLGKRVHVPKDNSRLRLWPSSSDLVQWLQGEWALASGQYPLLACAVGFVEAWSKTPEKKERERVRESVRVSI